MADAELLYFNGINGATGECETLPLTVQSAVKISALLAVPGGALLALPAAWKSFNAVLVEAGQSRATTAAQARAQPTQ